MLLWANERSVSDVLLKVPAEINTLQNFNREEVPTYVVSLAHQNFKKISTVLSCVQLEAGSSPVSCSFKTSDPTYETLQWRHFDDSTRVGFGQLTVGKLSKFDHILDCRVVTIAYKFSLHIT